MWKNWENKIGKYLSKMNTSWATLIFLNIVRQKIVTLLRGVGKEPNSAVLMRLIGVESRLAKNFIQEKS